MDWVAGGSSDRMRYDNYCCFVFNVIERICEYCRQISLVCYSGTRKTQKGEREMTRKAILIEASNIKGQVDLPGAREDVLGYETFLLSEFGGAWEKTEIEIIRHPTKSYLSRVISAASNIDYVFITFSGHGHHVNGLGICETRLCINDTEDIAVSSLNPGNARVTIVADSCRELTVLAMEKSAAAIGSSLNEARTKLRPNKQRCRDLFDKQVADAGKGVVTIYSCDLEETAADQNSFSRALVNVGDTWARRNVAGFLLLDSAFRTAVADITRKYPQQNPKMDAVRRLKYFPFAVLAF
jgi:hypothetical protein